MEQLENEMQDSRKDQRVHTRNDTDLGHAEERRATKPRAVRLDRAPQDHHGVLPMLNTATHAQKGKKENPGRLNERVTKNKSKSMEK